MITTFFAPRAIRNRRLPGRYAWQRPTRVCALLLAALALLPHLPALAQAPKAAPNVPAVWSDVDKTLSYEIALAAALRGVQQAPPLGEAQRQIAAEGAPALPPEISHMTVWSPITPERKLDDEEAIYRGANHWLPA